MSRTFLFAVISLALVAGCRELQEPPSDPAESEELPEQELYTATITFFKDDQLSTVLKAGRIRKYEEEQTVLMDSGLIVDFYDENGIHTMTLWADSGNANERTRNLMAAGNVIAVSDSGEQLETSILRWDNLTRRIISDAPVKISTPTDTIYGNSFVSDQHLKNWTIENPKGETIRERPPRSTSLLDTSSAPRWNPLADSLAIDSLAADTLP